MESVDFGGLDKSRQLWYKYIPTPMKIPEIIVDFEKIQPIRPTLKDSASCRHCSTLIRLIRSGVITLDEEKHKNLIHWLSQRKDNYNQIAMTMNELAATG